MEAVRHAIYGKDVNIGGKVVVDASSQRFGRQRLPQIQMRHLPQGVHARIRAAGAHEFERRIACQRADRGFEFALHRARILLLLPAAVFRSGIFDRELEPWHRSL